MDEECSRSKLCERGPIGVTQGGPQAGSLRSLAFGKARCEGIRKARPGCLPDEDARATGCRRGVIEVPSPNHERLNVAEPGSARRF